MKRIVLTVEIIDDAEIENESRIIKIDEQMYTETPEQLFRMYRYIMFCLGYHHETVNEYLPE